MSIWLNRVMPTLRLSGGASNSDPMLSLGGAKSSTPIVSASITNPAIISGVTITDTAGVPNGELTLTVTYISAGYYNLIFKDSEGNMSATVQVIIGNTSNKIATFFDYPTYGAVYLDINLGAMPAMAVGEVLTATASVLNLSQNLFADTTEAVLTAQDSVYRCIYIEAGADPVKVIRAYITKNFDTQDTLAIAVDPMVDGGIAIQIADELDSTNMLGGLSFTSPDSYDTGIAVGGSDLAAGSHRAIWVRRTSSLSAPSRVGLQSAVFGVGYIL